MIAIAFGTINIVGGFLVTDRMLEMFKAKPKPKPGRGRRRRRRPEGQGRRDGRRRIVIARRSATIFLQSESFIYVLYIVAFALFIQGLRGLAGPTTAVRGNRIAAVGMAIAVIATLLSPGEGNWGLIVLGVALGAAVGIPAARNVKMTAMPQMVALFNGVGGGAVALIAWVGVPPLRLDLRLAHATKSAARPRHISGVPTYVAIFSVFAAIVGSVSFWGSNIAFGKLQEIIPGRPISFGSAQQIVNLVLLILALAAGIDLIARGALANCCSSAC